MPTVLYGMLVGGRDGVALAEVERLRAFALRLGPEASPAIRRRTGGAHDVRPAEPRFQNRSVSDPSFWKNRQAPPPRVDLACQRDSD